MLGSPVTCNVDISGNNTVLTIFFLNFELCVAKQDNIVGTMTSLQAE